MIKPSMQKILLACLIGVLPVALVPAATAGKGPPRGVTLSAAPKVLAYGGSVGLAGTVVPAKENQSVSIEARSCGQSSFAPVIGVRTGANGGYNGGQAPVANTVYQAHWHSLTSALVPVRVRPRLTLTKLAPHKYRVKVFAVRSLAGHRVLFQRHRSKRWSTFRKLRLTYWGRVVATSVSGRIFKSKIHKKRKVRILLSRKQAAPCYASSHSRTIRS